jgi:hypothetical protein
VAGEKLESDYPLIQEAILKYAQEKCRRESKSATLVATSWRERRETARIQMTHRESEGGSRIVAHHTYTRIVAYHKDCRS